MEIGNWEINYFPDLISSWKLKMQEMHCILLVFYIGATFFCAREAWEMLYFTCIYTTGGGRAKMTEATQTTFFRDFFGKEMSENSGLATQYLLVYSDAVPGSIFRRWSRPIKAFFTRSPWSGLSDFHLPHVCAV